MKEEIYQDYETLKKMARNDVLEEILLLVKKERGTEKSLSKDWELNMYNIALDKAASIIKSKMESK